MEEFLAFCNKTQGRDKLYRITQYGSKLLGWHLQKESKNENLVNLLLQLEKNMSTSRKLFRFGRSVDSLKAAQRALNLQNYILQLTLSMSHGNKAIYLLIDHYIWLGKVGLVQVDLKKWNSRAYKFWLFSLVFAFLRDFYAIYVDMERSLQNAKYEDENHGITVKSFIFATIQVIKRNPQAVVDIIKNGCDMVIPAASLGYLNVNNGVVGFCGVVSSLLAAAQISNPSLKLKPS